MTVFELRFVFSVEYMQIYAMLCLVAQSCPTLCDCVDCSPPGSSVHEGSSGKNTGVGCHALLQGNFPNLGSNPGIPHCKWIFTIWATKEAQVIKWLILKLESGFLVKYSFNYIANYFLQFSTVWCVRSLILSEKYLITMIHQFHRPKLVLFEAFTHYFSPLGGLIFIYF